MCVDNKVQETIGDVYYPTCRNEKCVYIWTIETTSFYDCKKCKAGCHVLNIPFKDQKPTIMLVGGDGTYCFAKKTSRDYVKEKSFPFLKKILRQSQPSTSEIEPKKGQIETKYGINVSVSFWLMIWATFWIFKSFYSISIYTQPVNFIQLTVNLHKIIMIFSVSNDGIQ